MKDNKQNKKGKNFKKPFKKKNGSSINQKGPMKKPASFKIKDISEKIVGKTVYVAGVIDSISQTGGPTLFYVDDGTGTFSVKGFKSPGERAYEEIQEGDVVRAKIQVSEYQGEYEGEIETIHKLEDAEAEKVKEERNEVLRQRAKPAQEEFMIKSDILEKLKPKFIKAATEIKLAIMQNRPIIVRHHNDVDGYSSGFALEKAIIPLIKEQHNSAKAPWENYKRAPCTSPFYEIDDSIRDTSLSLRDVAKFSNKMPLVIIADNGSTEQDLMGIKQGKIHGMDFIVVDHHYFEKDVISNEVLEHINPFLAGYSGQEFSAGMLATELARFISAPENIGQIPAMAGIADRIDNESAINQYLEIAQNNNYNRELLDNIATVIDFVSAKLKFMEAREYIEVLFGEPRKQQKDLVDLMAPYIKSLEQRGLEIGKEAAQIEDIGEVKLQRININTAFPGFGFYPKPGKALGFVHDNAEREKGYNKLVSIGVLDSAVTIRATDDSNFSVNQLIEFLHEKIPEAFVEGGGHKNAGSINFIPKKKDEIVELLKEFIRKSNE